MATKTSMNTSIFPYFRLLLVVSVNNIYYANAWCNNKILSPSSIVPLSLMLPLPFASKAFIRNDAIPINNLFSNRNRCNTGNFNIFQTTRRLNTNICVGKVDTSLHLNYGESRSLSSPSSISDVDVDVMRDNRNALEEEELPFMGVGRLYHSPASKPEVSESPSNIIHRLKKSTVAVVGIGGVGSWAAEALVRSGVGNIVLIDLDDICVSNTNRQVHATSQTVGMMKTDEMKRRMLEINPTCNVTIVHDFISVDNAYTVVESLLPQVDIILDAIDGATEKAALIAAACVHSLPIVTCGGAAGRIDPTQIVCDDLTKCADCRLLFSVKKRLRDEYKLFSKGPSKNGDIKRYRPRKWRIPAIFSTELQKKVDGTEEVSSLRRCDGGLGTACFVTGTYGFVAASKVVEMIVHQQLVKPRVLQSSLERIKSMNEVQESQPL